MRFGVLGTLEIERDDGTQTVIQQARLRSLLTVLLVNRGQALSTERLGFLLWGTDVPAKADHAIHAYISALRRQLKPAEVIKNARPGYHLDLALHLLDVDEFHELRDLGAAAFSAGNFSHACILLDQACALWRNPGLPDFPRTPLIQGIAAKLTAELHAAHDMLIDAQLAIGQHREVIPVLRAKTVAQPGHEVAWAQLMIALYRSEMRAMALNVYLEAREALRNVSGIDPGPSIRLLHEQMLQDIPSL
jgi:DNA-binding SARP family transcriptional activator